MGQACVTVTERAPSFTSEEERPILALLLTGGSAMHAVDMPEVSDAEKESARRTDIVGVVLGPIVRAIGACVIVALVTGAAWVVISAIAWFVRHPLF